MTACVSISRSGTDVAAPASASARRALPLVAAAASLALVAAAVLLVLYARGGGPVPGFLGFLTPKPPDPLAASSPAEAALRTLRLAGYDQAVVGESGGVAVVRIAVPEASTPRAVELSWQTALAVGASAYPRSGKVIAQLFTGSTPLLEVSADADVVREAARRDDAAAVRSAASFRYLSTAGGTE